MLAVLSIAVGMKSYNWKIWQGGSNFSQTDLAAGYAKCQYGETTFTVPNVLHLLPSLRSGIPV